MNVASYYLKHAIPTGWQTLRIAFNIWCDLLKGNYENYALPAGDTPYNECREWFWFYLGCDAILPKECLEDLIGTIDKIEAGEIELVSIQDVMKNLEDRLDGDV